MRVTDLELNGHDEEHIRPEPHDFLGNSPTFFQPSIQAVIPGRTNNFNSQQVLGHHEIGLFYGMTPSNQFPASSCNIVVSSAFNNHRQYLANPAASRDLALPANPEAHNQLPFSRGHRMVQGPAVDRTTTNQFFDGQQASYMGQEAEGLPSRIWYDDSLGNSGVIMNPGCSRLLDSGARLINAVPFPHPGSGDSSGIIRDGTLPIVRNRSGITGLDPLLAHNACQFSQANYAGQPFLFPGNPRFSLKFNNCGDANHGTWNPRSTFPCMPGNINGRCIAVGNVGLHGYQVASNRYYPAFLPLPSPQELPYMHYPSLPVLAIRGHAMNLILQPTPFLRVQPYNSMSVRGVLGTVPRYTGSVPPSGVRPYRPNQRDTTQEINTRLLSIPHLRVLPEDGGAIMEVSDNHELGGSIDQHRDMRLDIDHMSYEELLDLGEQIGCVGTGLSEEAIASKLKIRLFVSSSACSVDESPCSDHEVEFCVICQADYKSQEHTGALECGHEYHADCITKWLRVKDSCPICKSS